MSLQTDPYVVSCPTCGHEHVIKSTPDDSPQTPRSKAFWQQRNKPCPNCDRMRAVHRVKT